MENTTPNYEEMKHKYDGRESINVDGRTLRLINVKKLPAHDFEPRVLAWDAVKDEDVSYTLNEFHDLMKNESEQDDTMQCPDCERDHAEWLDKGTAGTPPGHRGMLDLWECENCGFTLEGARL